jgi:Phage Terminase
MQEMTWLPNPKPGTAICMGFDGSENDDWSALQAETIDGMTFTPRYGPDMRAAIWNPAQEGGSIPRDQVHVAVDEMFQRYRVERFYCDPHDWYSEIGEWAVKYGDNHVFEWPTNKVSRMYPEIKRFEIDLAQGRLTHDGCPIATVHAANAKKLGKFNQQYVLGKPANHQKIDAIMARILAHTAASDARGDGWTATPARRRVVVS